MRDAFAVESDDDFDLPAVVRRKASPRPQQKRTGKRPQRKIGMGERLAAQALKHPGRVVAFVFLAGCAGAIAWNALLMQNARHPAPLFSHREPAMAEAPALAPDATQPLPPARPLADGPETQAVAVPEMYESASPAAPAPASAPRPASRGAISDLIRNNGVPNSVPQRAQQAAVQTPAPPPAPAPAPAPASPPSRAQTVRDPIAEMIRLGGPIPTPPANVGRPDGGDLVLSGQRALARLGYGVKVDGMMGPGTRQAIERFEQDRHLPVTGTFNARTVRELSSLSGIAVQ